ncbi:hypothetical protein PPERSA_03064 [Pseudocohnilembus persalinus]|uniref:Uncharacterized protein n=1 Tax=Pseudocohnilembus persalinus TaxID=266149 RepID=A0A0V0R955_PSEPJ|nr:hypothetical protein PPERSA_03064 [Pseudocohnilembus persalinus]|eukprot:KRX11006.1 hypothetical protein PPERSA_03064 [Pseudocohnilembus persalinus]
MSQTLQQLQNQRKMPSIISMKEDSNASILREKDEKNTIDMLNDVIQMQAQQLQQLENQSSQKKKLEMKNNIQNQNQNLQINTQKDQISKQIIEKNKQTNFKENSQNFQQKDRKKSVESITIINIEDDDEEEQKDAQKSQQLISQNKKLQLEKEKEKQFQQNIQQTNFNQNMQKSLIQPQSQQEYQLSQINVHNSGQIFGQNCEISLKNQNQGQGQISQVENDSNIQQFSKNRVKQFNVQRIERQKQQLQYQEVQPQKFRFSVGQAIEQINREVSSQTEKQISNFKEQRFLKKDLNQTMLKYNQFNNNQHQQRGYQKFFNRGFSNFQRQNFESAERNFLKAIQNNPLDQKSLMFLALTYNKQQRPLLAIKYYFNLLQINPKCKKAILNLANCYLMLNMYNQAKERYRQLIEIDPKNQKAYFNLSITYVKLQQFSLAYQTMGQFYQETEKEDCGNINIYLGNIIFEQGNLGRALEFYQKGVLSNFQEIRNINCIEIKQYIKKNFKCLKKMIVQVYAVKEQLIGNYDDSDFEENQVKESKIKNVQKNGERLKEQKNKFLKKIKAIINSSYFNQNNKEKNIKLMNDLVEFFNKKE